MHYGWKANLLAPEIRVSLVYSSLHNIHPCARYTGSLYILFESTKIYHYNDIWVPRLYVFCILCFHLFVLLLVV